MLPAPAQGALAIECRAGDTGLAALLAELDDADTRAAVTAERALLAELEAGCSAPVGAIAEVVESIDEDGRVFDELSLRGCVAALDGSDVIRASGIGTTGSGTGARALGGRGAVRAWARATHVEREAGERSDERGATMTTRGRKPRPGRITFVGLGSGRPGPADDAGARRCWPTPRWCSPTPTCPSRCWRLSARSCRRCPGPRRPSRPPAEPDDGPDGAQPAPTSSPPVVTGRTRHPARAGRSGRGGQDAGRRGRTGRRRGPAGGRRPAVGRRGHHRGERRGPQPPALRDRAGPARQHAVPTYAGLPLGSSHTVADVRGDVDWAALAAAPGPADPARHGLAPGRRGAHADRVRAGRHHAVRGHREGHHLRSSVRWSPRWPG